MQSIWKCQIRAKIDSLATLQLTQKARMNFEKSNIIQKKFTKSKLGARLNIQFPHIWREDNTTI